MPVFSTLILAAAMAPGASAQGVDWSRDPVAQVRIEAAPARMKEKKEPKDESQLLSSVSVADSRPLSPEELACEPDVIAGFKHIFHQAGDGHWTTEAAMRIDVADGRRVIMISPPTGEPKAMSVPITDHTVAIAHTHPHVATPSWQDETAPVPDFVLTLGELWVTNPRPGKHQPSSRKVRGDDWSKPCAPRK